jgi:hypothetical protein
MNIRGFLHLKDWYFKFWFSNGKAATIDLSVVVLDYQSLLAESGCIAQRNSMYDACRTRFVFEYKQPRYHDRKYVEISSEELYSMCDRIGNIIQEEV